VKIAAVCALVLAIPRTAVAQPDASPSTLPELPPPTVEPPVGSPAAPPPAPAPPPPVEAPPPVASAPVSSEAPPETAHGTSFADLPKLIVASAGFGLSVPYTDRQSNSQGGGFYGAAEFVLVTSMWFSPRAYAGVLLTNTDAGSCDTPGCDVHASIGFLGAKGRLTIPIPYVAPYIEAGLGASVGNLTTRVYDIDVDFTGVTYHVPFAFGLSIGNMHDYFVDLGFSFLFHPAQSQANGALAFSLAFSLK
jgi:hypothetical protein